MNFHKVKLAIARCDKSHYFFNYIYFINLFYMDYIDLYEKTLKHKHEYDNQLTPFLLNLEINNFNSTKKIIKEVCINQNGGDGILQEYIIGNEKFIARLEKIEGSDNEGNRHKLQFVSIDDINEKSIKCLVVEIDDNKKIAHIIELGNFENCLWSVNKKLVYKIGLALIHIVINICKKNI